MATNDDDEVPKIGRGRRTRGLMPSPRMIVTILMTLTTLIVVVAMRTSCSKGVARVFDQMSGVVDAGVRYVPAPRLEDLPPEGAPAPDVERPVVNDEVPPPRPPRPPPVETWVPEGSPADPGTTIPHPDRRPRPVPATPGK
jgi:hypothetical protein